MNSNAELKNHLIWEFYNGAPNGTNILAETRGVVSGIGAITDYLTAEIKPLVNKLFNPLRFGKSVNKSYTGIVPENIKTFFKKYTFNIVLEKSKNDAFSGGINPSKSLIDTQSGLVLEPYIELHVEGDDKETILYTLKLMIGHELTHGYNMLQYGLKNGKTRGEIVHNAFVDQRYSAISDAKNAPFFVRNRAAIGHLCYLFNRMERNAYIAQLENELDEMHNQIIDANSAMNCIKKTESWKKFKHIEQNIKIINSLTDPSIQESIITSTNEVMNTEFSNYEQVKKYYTRRWNRWKKKYLTTSSKIAHDIFDRYHNQSMDGDMSSNPMIGING